MSNSEQRKWSIEWRNIQQPGKNICKSPISPRIIIPAISEILKAQQQQKPPPLKFYFWIQSFWRQGWSCVFAVLLFNVFLNLLIKTWLYTPKNEEIKQKKKTKTCPRIFPNILKISLGEKAFAFYFLKVAPVRYINKISVSLSPFYMKANFKW